MAKNYAEESLKKHYEWKLSVFDKTLFPSVEF